MEFEKLQCDQQTRKLMQKPCDKRLNKLIPGIEERHNSAWEAREKSQGFFYLLVSTNSSKF